MVIRGEKSFLRHPGMSLAGAHVCCSAIKFKNVNMGPPLTTAGDDAVLNGIK
jgi:hypothetical protein